jgi:3-hydroxyacyl-[acyl-carrier-protein] dehydratase
MDTPNNTHPEEAPAPISLDILEIMALIPHRYPFLLIDRVVELTRTKRIVAIKNVSMNEGHFQGHFPAYPIMPGVLIVEALAQAGGVLLMYEIPDRESKLLFFTGIEEAKFRRSVVPGDQVRLEVDVLSFSKRGGRMQGNAYVDGKLVCEAIIRCQLVPRDRKSEAEKAAAPEKTVPEKLEPVTHG